MGDEELDDAFAKAEQAKGGLSDCDEFWDESLKYYLAPGNATVESVAVSHEELLEAREKAREKLGQQALRSCWLCNDAHYYFLDQPDFFLMCFSCGRFYYGGIDITER